MVSIYSPHSSMKCDKWTSHMLTNLSSEEAD
uniref:Uncharacterized protein n=1 Tax=Arundo donax TaxID=35708 RepID=A0A0A9CGR9_ARUDO